MSVIEKKNVVKNFFNMYLSSIVSIYKRVATCFTIFVFHS